MSTQIKVLLTAMLALAVSAVVPSAHAAGSLDQGNSFKGDSSSSAVLATQSMAQIFTAGLSGSLTNVGLGIKKNGTVTNLTVGIYASAGGLPTGSALASTTLTGAGLAVVPTGQTIFDVEFTSPAAVNSASTYAIVVTTTDSGGASYSWYYGTAYSGGTEAYRTSGAWTAGAGDFTFKTYVGAREADATVAPRDELLPASVIQQFAKPSTGSCADAASATLNWAGVDGGGWAESWAQWVNDDNGGAICSRTLNYSTAQSRWVVG